MFDYEKEEQATTEEVSPDWENAEWEEITSEHADQEDYVPLEHVDPTAIKNEGKREAFSDFYAKRHQHRKDNIAVGSVRYAMLAIGLTVIGYLVRSTTWLAITLGVIALVFGLTAAFGAGKYKEM